MKSLLIIVGVALMIYSILTQKKGEIEFQFLSYWKNLKPLGVIIYTAGLMVIVFTVIFL